MIVVVDGAAALCPKCGGNIEGDGYTSVYHCEYAEEDEYIYSEPDADPVYCDYVEEE